MGKWGWVLKAVVLIMFFGFYGTAKAEDVVYLKDGSVIHGTITEEVPGKSLKIETKDGNVFVYKMRQIDKITHTAPAAADSETGTAVSSVGSKPTPVPEVNDPHAKFNKFGFLLNGGFFSSEVVNQFNAALEAGTKSNSYDFLPGWFKAGMGIGWFTNGFGLKWDFQFSLQPNDYSTNWYYGGYYTGTTTEDTYLFWFGTELEADIDMDNVINKDNVTSFYIPVIVGLWDVDYNVTTAYGSDDFSNTTSVFGTGIGVRGFDSSNLLWDFQLAYRFSARGNYLTDSSGYRIPNPNGKYIEANMSGLDLNFTVGFLFQ